MNLPHRTRVFPRDRPCRTGEETGERGYGPGPWLPGTPENLATGYYQAAQVLAIGLVLTGSALLGRRRPDARRATSDGAAS
ncbi:hypothetical protein [Streptomyces sp. NRRL S-448]|uniref:hypothetical protein n=1 Tax=Streptomyces sp. NRRL S-448 TaxID=1463907 RepID=UPI000A69BDF2